MESMVTNFDTAMTKHSSIQNDSRNKQAISEKNQKSMNNKFLGIRKLVSQFVKWLKSP
jgi:hypothetical protein